MNYKEASGQLSNVSLYAIFLLVFFTPKLLSAQTIQDSVQLKKSQEINRKFPHISLVDVQYTFYTPTKIKTKLIDNDYLNANIRNQQLLTTSVNIPLLLTKKFYIVNSFRYEHETMGFENVDSAYQSIFPNLSKAEQSNLYVDDINFIYSGKIFNRKLMCSFSSSFDFSSHGLERSVQKLTVSVGLKQTSRTSIALGLIGNTDPGRTQHIVPLISVSHWMDSKWLIDCFIPAYMYVRRVFDDNSRLSFGLDLTNGGVSFVHPEIPTVSSYTFQRGRMELAANYQKIIGSGLTLSSKIGYSLSLDDKVMEAKSTDVLMKIKQQPNFSLNIGLSYNFIPKKYRKKDNSIQK